MSLLPYIFDPVGCYPSAYYRPHSTALNSFREVDRAMSSMLNQLQRLPQQDMGTRLQYDDKGDLTVCCQVSGFKHNELSVDVTGESLVLKGHHTEERDGESVERKFTRVVRLPKELDQSKIKCELDGEHELKIFIPRYEQLAAQKQSVPISVKKSDPKQQQEPSKK